MIGAAKAAAAYSAPGPPVAGYVAWYDASDLASITESGGAVSQWNDKSGNGHHVSQSTAAQKPTTGTRTQNSLNVIDFQGTNSGGSDDTLEVTGRTIASQPGTVFLVAKGDGGHTNNQGFIDGGAPSSSSSTRWVVYMDTPGALKWAVYAGSGPISSVAGVDNVAHQFTAIVNGASSSLRIDGSSVASGNAGSNNLTNGIRFGSYQTGNPQGNLDGWIAEVIIYPSALGSTDRDAVEAYLKAKWGTP